MSESELERAHRLAASVQELVDYALAGAFPLVRRARPPKFQASLALGRETRPKRLDVGGPTAAQEDG